MMQNVLKLFFAICILGVSSLQAQTVTGTITDAIDGSPLPGVNVIIKGTSNGVSANFDGEYSIDLSGTKAVLVFTYMGYKAQEVAVNGKAVINVALEQSAESLNEVVITALGIKRETKKLGFAMTEVKGEELTKTNAINPVLALQGKSAGLSIGASDGGLFGNSKIQIRGVSSLNSSNNQPIFVIDGVILENETSGASEWAASSNDYGNILKNLNPDDYKSISVLKGAAATALYGSRGINGVILIQSKDGAKSKGLGVSFKQTVGMDVVYKQPGIQYEFGLGYIAGYVRYGEKDENGKFDRFNTMQKYYNTDGDASLINHPGGMGYGPAFDGGPVVGYDGEMTTFSPVRDNMIAAYDTGYNTNTSIALKGGNEKGSFYLSDSYNVRTGTLPGSEFKRNSLLLSASYKLSKWLQAKGSISLANSTSSNADNSISISFMDGSFKNTFDTNKYKQEKYWLADHGGIQQSKYDDPYNYVPGKGLWFGYANNNQERKEQVVRPVVSLSATVTDWLTLGAEGSMNMYTIKSENKALGAGLANEGGYYAISHSTNESYTGKISANISKDISPNFSSSLFLGAEIWKQEKSSSFAHSDGGLIVPGKFFLGNSKKTLVSGGGIGGTKQINSAYFMASFGYKDQLFLDITGRNDWSSALVYTDGTGNNSYFYPSVSTSWLVDETFELPEWVSFAKFRASWAKVGKDTSSYFINRAYSVGKTETEGGQFIYKNAVSTSTVDRSIMPELKTSYEIGADIRFFGNRLGFDVAYYDDSTANQIGTIPIPGVSGYSNLVTNIGTLNNKGFELSITGKPVKTENFVWETTINYWKDKTTITKLHKDYGAFKTLNGNTGYGDIRVSSVAYEGGEYGVLMSGITPALWQSTDADGNNIADPRNGMKLLNWSAGTQGAYFKRATDVKEVGKLAPDFEASFMNNFKYKNFNVNVALDARYGGHIASYSNRYGTAYGTLNTSLAGRSPKFGGLTWTSQTGDSAGKTYSDGVIPDGIFAEGQEVTGPQGKVDVGGMTYQEAFDAGMVEPTHASGYHYFSNSWGQGTVNDNWVSEVKYIALRSISVGYSLPKTVAEKIGAKSLYVALSGRNLGYLYNSLPNDLNPESFRGTTSSGTYLERTFSPYTANYSMTVAIDF
ncbi:MAG: SusC/RagA family TonB-linked outer membrane protein [Flavobacteriaceae bacterium]|nr:MAG: SusC/RagA family TonB-linked outer membrane protein [Flavobacteriaceae bacterium]